MGARDKSYRGKGREGEKETGGEGTKVEWRQWGKGEGGTKGVEGWERDA